MCLKNNQTLSRNTTDGDLYKYLKNQLVFIAHAQRVYANIIDKLFIDFYLFISILDY